MTEVIRALILAAAVQHGVSLRLMDCMAFRESTWGSRSSNLYQLMSPGKADEFYAWELEQGFLDHRLYDPARQANFVAEQLLKGAGPSAWRGTYWPCLG